MFRTILVLSILCAGCSSASFDLDPKWSPLTIILEKPYIANLVADKTMITTIGDTLYVYDLKAFLKNHPKDSMSFNRIMTHERVHAIRQTSGIPFLGKVWWILKYLLSADFMWDEERVALYFEYKHSIRRAPAGDAKAFSEQYHSIFFVPMVPYDDALLWITQTQNNSWKPDITDEEFKLYKTPNHPTD
jgi:hypothetical protein